MDLLFAHTFVLGVFIMIIAIAMAFARLMNHSKFEKTITVLKRAGLGISIASCGLALVVNLATLANKF